MSISGSTDGSVEAAQAAGAHVVQLDLSLPFTAARARNAGIDALAAGDRPTYVQFVDGDCELQPGWLATAAAFLDRSPMVAVAFGRLRERFPQASIYNALCDREAGHASRSNEQLRRHSDDEVDGNQPGRWLQPHPDRR